MCDTNCFGLLQFVFVMTWACFGPALPVEAEFQKFYCVSVVAFVLCVAMFVVMVLGFLFWCQRQLVASLMWLFLVGLVLQDFLVTFYLVGWDRNTDEVFLFGRYIRFGDLREKHPEFASWFRATALLWPLCGFLWLLLTCCGGKDRTSRQDQHQILV